MEIARVLIGNNESGYNNQKNRGCIVVENPYLTVEQVAEILSVTPETVRGYITAKKNPLPAYRLGREYRIDRKDFDDWMRKRKNVRDDER